MEVEGIQDRTKGSVEMDGLYLWNEGQAAERLKGEKDIEGR